MISCDMSHHDWVFCVSSSSCAEFTGILALLGSHSCSHVLSFTCKLSNLYPVFSHVLLFCVESDQPLSFVYKPRVVRFRMLKTINLATQVQCKIRASACGTN